MTFIFPVPGLNPAPERSRVNSRETSKFLPYPINYFIESFFIHDNINTGARRPLVPAFYLERSFLKRNNE